jgi:hypothetical protein
MKKAYEIPAFARHLNKFCASERGPDAHWTISIRLI